MMRKVEPRVKLRQRDKVWTSSMPTPARDLQVLFREGYGGWQVDELAFAYKKLIVTNSYENT